MTCLGIDWGEKRIGLAVGESSLSLALPLKTVDTIDEIVSIAKEEEAGLIVLGCPYKMNGRGDLDKRFSKFHEDLKEKFSNIILVDERLSSQAADALQGYKTKLNRDQLAAMVILQGYFDSL